MLIGAAVVAFILTFFIKEDLRRLKETKEMEEREKMSKEFED